MAAIDEESFAAKNAVTLIVGILAIHVAVIGFFLMKMNNANKDEQVRQTIKRM